MCPGAPAQVTPGCDYLYWLLAWPEPVIGSIEVGEMDPQAPRVPF